MDTQLDLSTLIDGFLLDCRARNLAEGTLKRAYEPCLRELTDFLDDPHAVTANDLRRFVLHLRDRNLSSWTIHRYIRVIKRLFNWAVTEGIVHNNPAKKLAFPRLPHGRIDFFSKEEINVMLDAARDSSFRDYTICFLFLDSGLRRAELAALALDDVNVMSGVITVRHGKGDKYRRVRVGNTCRKILWRYVNEFRKSETNALFVSHKGRPISGNAVAQMLRKLSRKTDIHTYAHKFRHTYATLFATKVPNALLLADALGHSTLEMSQKYVHLAGTQSTDNRSVMDDLFK